MNIRETLNDALQQALQAAGAPPDSPALVQIAGKPEFGDYQANGVMAAAKKLKTKPRDMAADVVAKLALDDLLANVEIAGPGFINLFLRDDWLSEQLTAMQSDARVGVETAPAKQKVVVDYSSPNLAKEMHVGHLRSTIIGDAVVRVLEFLGHEVIRQNHVGDWGTQFGMLIAYMERLQAKGEASIALKDLEKFYQAAKKLFDEDAAFAQTARDYVVKLQGGDPDCLASWQQFIEVSLQHCEQIYERLNVTLRREHVMPESAYNDDLANVLVRLREKELLTESDGAQCVFLDEFTGKDGTPLPMIVQKSDGGYLYSTTDLAAAYYRGHTLNVDRTLYFVDTRQKLHLQHLFAVSKRAGFMPDDREMSHHAFGAMLGEDGKPFKTRAGGTVKLVDLLDEAIERAYQLVSEKNPEQPEAERREIARVVGIGAVKYADLSKNRTNDYVFNWDTMLSFDGNTAPYLQYAYARINSIFNRAGETPDGTATIRIEAPEERALGIKLMQFPEVVNSVAQDCYPNQLCAYLYELATLFMRYYEACPVLKAEAEVRQSRLGLCGLTANIMKTGLDLLGIDVLDRM